MPLGKNKLASFPSNSAAYCCNSSTSISSALGVAHARDMCGSDDKVVAIIDVAKIGPDYLPGHGHADTLSFELSINTQES